MNLALLFDDDFIAEDRARLTGRRLAHLRSVLKAGTGDQVPVGRVNGRMGMGEVLRLSDTEAELRVQLTQLPPPALPLTLVLAMPRPKMFRRVLQTCASLGVKDLWLIHSYKVEKSFWQTPWLSEPHLRENLTLGLEQARDTVMPRVQVRQRFKPFVEDELPGLLAGRQGWVAHPGTATPCPVHVNAPALLCIGPEGGFTPYEVGKLEEAGCQGVHLGPRILRVETAVPVLVSRLFDACR
ncbi:16S rRNA (uracil(1498)-N(3))-methyltransferase [Marinobacter lutaoensis]|uniref:Ribosomal RNA small subunit methyltransferase E n=1 Tax=Marinobacter lutaoensis TaxID=135739 RepID=A0A1V2DRX4_9GAMM|nr:16S rRNA (uracil(1498)-N(3))-methyltransferase [Marinobacter lutaoensis]MBE02552.1 16S rRNA (uracil(1498)-N(3))-methyltransferase [Marinobacter sp.]MBI43653.1 16S rRNA (uracil(1498)-N(3))-methyltransferase [Oceanospirillales bacterium]ONF43377.1 16S rRNA (uracil(1498)-N(3))-methyltransferase [Marinobacter lutaoensis]|tara:strand:- start:2105 stop:2824 length:720 start_codon:yes stop_codon:yes gene_type:complete